MSLPQDSSTVKQTASRRDFVKKTVATAGVLGFPTIVPSTVFGQTAPSNRIRVGQIGCGRIAQQHDVPGVINSKLADYVGVCDLDSKRAAAGKTFVENAQRRANPNQPVPEIKVHTNYEEMLARTDIDAVVLSLPDHQHAQVALSAVYANKDIYLQKPFTMTIEEGIILRDAILKSNIVFQVGSQQRSQTQFREACELVRSGRVGQLTRVEVGLPVDPTAPDDPEQPIPENLNYDLWLGPTPQVYYTEQRVHSQRQSGSRPGWLRNEAYSLGMITGWGAHHFDTAHVGMGMELTGPTKIEGKGEFPTNKIWNVHGAYDIELTYPGNVVMAVSDKFPNGIRFIGKEGWIFVSRGPTPTTSSDPSVAPTTLKALDSSDPKLIADRGNLKVQLYRSTEHHLNWLECVKSRKPTIAPAAEAHRSTSACVLGWIAMKLKKPLTFDPKAEKFINDAVANSMLSRPERGNYGAVQMSKKHKA